MGGLYTRTAKGTREMIRARAEEIARAADTEPLRVWVLVQPFAFTSKDSKHAQSCGVLNAVGEVWQRELVLEYIRARLRMAGHRK